MNSVETELKILTEILTKKVDELETILAITENQEVLLGQPPSLERVSFFKEMSSEKQKHIDEVLKCDSVFQTIFDNIKEEIMERNAKKYRNRLIVIQQHIDAVLEYDVKIRAQEAKNRTILSEQMPRGKKLPASNTQKQQLMLKYKQNSNLDIN